jgi:hypothetical protein
MRADPCLSAPYYRQMKARSTKPAPGLHLDYGWTDRLTTALSGHSAPTEMTCSQPPTASVG